MRDPQLKTMMEKLNKLANAVHNAPDKGMKQIWSDKWYSLVKQYASTIESMEVSKPDPYNEHLNKTKGER
jgi:hypothetical protein|tara:strand:- start:381 stop:590 length:210 start_codon:yes stop_codon:yes gene_type:complete